MSGYVVAPTGSGHRKNKNHSKEHVQLAANSTQLDSHCEMIEHATCELFQMIPIGSTFFHRGQRGKVSGLYAGSPGRWALVSSTPEATPCFLKVYWKLDLGSAAVLQERIAKV